MTSLRIGTRGSPLALWQAHYVSDRLRAAGPGLDIELVKIQTEGDEVRDTPLVQLAGEGVFTKAIQHAVLENRVELAVHSLKDLPTIHVDRLILAAVPPRGPIGDVMVSLKHRSFAELPTGAVVATGSLRRRAQLLSRRPDLKLVDMRGNVETRLRKLAEENLDATILAQAGLERLKLCQHITEVLDPTWMLPAVGQGALGLECRRDDLPTRKLLEKIDDPPTRHAVLAERAMLRGLGGGCQVPIASLSRLTESRLSLQGVVLSPDGGRRISLEIEGPIEQAESLGQILAEQLLAHGARGLLQA